ncbi:cytochrome P450 [Streptomyces sp. SID13031]|uniref:cytochrome P450 n=1 Tax=Streptomyces sp. SID13031 TaxID=2706046 RepID=UPI0013C6CD3C|nr:cytochrome P450 [Streptomyces sp. SID13031]NEA36869.1 cytochrome P450 [Streptomyces sp. SID13031]
MSSSSEVNVTGADGCPARHGFEPFRQDDPFPAYAALRAEAPVMFDERIGYWVVTRFADVKAVFEDRQTFSSENAQAPVREHGRPASKIMADGGFTAYSGLSARVPPDHPRIRRIVAREFTPRRYKVLEPVIRRHVVGLLENMLAREFRHGDLVRDLANDVPTVTILSLFGADISRVETYKRWSASRTAMTWGDLDDEQQIPHAHNLVEYWQECLRLVDDAHGNERDSLVGDLVRAQVAGDPISDHEIASVCYSMLFAGHETTTTFIANALQVLLDRPEQWERLVADPVTFAGNAMEEVLRFSPSIVAWRRRATAAATIGGVTVPEGADILLVLGSANRDSAKFEDPESFDLTRVNARENLSFGFGPHFCLGSALAKLQLRIVIEEVARRAPRMRLDDAYPTRFADNLSFRSPTAVRVRWEA